MAGVDPRGSLPSLTATPVFVSHLSSSSSPPHPKNPILPPRTLPDEEEEDVFVFIGLIRLIRGVLRNDDDNARDSPL